MQGDPQGVEYLFNKAWNYARNELENVAHDFGRSLQRWFEREWPQLQLGQWQPKLDRFLRDWEFDGIAVEQRSYDELVAWLREWESHLRQFAPPTPPAESHADRMAVIAPSASSSRNETAPAAPVEYAMHFSEEDLDTAAVKEAIAESSLASIPAADNAATPGNPEQVPLEGGVDDLDWIPFERHMESGDWLYYKTRSMRWWKVPLSKVVWRGKEVYDLRGAVEFHPTFVQEVILEHGGGVDDIGLQVIIRHYRDEFGLEAGEQLLKDLATTDASEAANGSSPVQAPSFW